MYLSAIFTLLKEKYQAFENDGGLLYRVLGQ